MVGDAGRARKLLDWKPEHSFDDTLMAVLNDCRARVAHVGNISNRKTGTVGVNRHIDDMNDRKKAPTIPKAALKQQSDEPKHQLPAVPHSIFWWPFALVRGLFKIIIVSLGRALAKRRWSVAIVRTVLLPFPTLRWRIRKVIAIGPRPEHAPKKGIKMFATVARRWIAALAKRGLSRFPTLLSRIENLVAPEPEAPPYESAAYKAMIVASKKWNFSKRLGGR
jgi:hypothetical protein